jgi:hypothetical protein
MKFPFPTSPQYTAITLAYRNRDLIADLVLPRMTVGAREFRWNLRNKSEFFTVPDTKVGRKSQPNEVEFTATEQSGFVQDYGLDDVVPNLDIEVAQQSGQRDPLGVATEGVTELVALDREKRVASLVFSAGTYPTGNKVTLSGTSQWSDPASDPVTAILTAKEGSLVDFNTLVLSSQAWLQLRKHPKLVAAAFPAGGNASAGGYVSLQAVADLFEVDRILVGKSWSNTAKPGQTASYGRIWGKHAALLSINARGGLTGSDITFGGTAQWGGRVAAQINEPKIGLRGSQRIRVGESVQELIMAPDAGYFFENVVA